MYTDTLQPIPVASASKSSEWAINMATSRRAVDLLINEHPGYHCPTRLER